MAWAVYAKDWTAVEEVKDNLADVIRTISRFELVRLLTPHDQLGDARARFAGGNVEIIEAPVDDIWMRDIAPTFALRDGEVVAIDLNFNGWGNTTKRRARPGDRLAATASAIFGVPRICAAFIAEGGAIITDGEGTLVTTESCLLNRNRNPFGSKAERKQNIQRALHGFGIRHVIWLKGDASEPITSGHIDGYALFTAPGAVLVETMDGGTVISQQREQDIAALENASDAAGRRLRIGRIWAPRVPKEQDGMFAASYLNAYVANGAVIAARFCDDERDELARIALETAFPGRQVKMLKINHILNGGGGAHCLTQPMVATR